MRPRVAHLALGRRLRIQSQADQDGSDDLDIHVAAVRAALELEIEDTVEQLGSTNKLASSKPALQQCPVVAARSRPKTGRERPVPTRLPTSEMDAKPITRR